MDAADLRQYFGWLEKFGKHPCSADDVGTVLPGTLPPVQRAVLGALAALAPIPVPEVRMHLRIFFCCLRHATHHIVHLIIAHGCATTR